MTDRTRKLGKTGEKKALAHLKSNHYKIIETNFRTPFAELDIIAKDGSVLCFIEVKTRTSIKTGLPGESVTPAKQKKIILGATAWLKGNSLFDSVIRFDVVEVFDRHGKLSVNIIKNAFQAD